MLAFSVERGLKDQSIDASVDYSPRARPETARSGKLDRARSRLYRSQILQENMRWKALAEIYTLHSSAPFSNLNFFVKNAEILLICADVFLCFVD